MEIDNKKPKNYFGIVRVFSKQALKNGKYYSSKVGPGIVSGAADDDPSGIATYSQLGAMEGFKYMWLSIYTFPLMAIIQEMCARIAVATGKGLAQNISIYFPRYVIYTITVLLFISNTFNIGADLGAMSESLVLLFPSIPSYIYLVIIALICITFEIYSNYATYSKYLKWLTFTLLAYVVVGVFTNFNPIEIIKYSFIPTISFSKDSIIIITAVLGTTISPYLFFWQTSQEIEEEILDSKTESVSHIEKKEQVKIIRYDVWIGMFFSNLVMFFIIAVCADNLFANGIRNINSAAEAASALKPIAGNFAYILFSLGIIGTGFLAIPVLAGSSAYAISESFKWKEGLYLKFREARPFYLIILVSVVLGLIQNFLGIHPFKALIYSALLNGIIAPVIIIFILIIAKREDIMGELRNSRVGNFFGTVLFLLMLFCAVATIWQLL